jgi:lantibiotic transport system ATP-binding protein
VYTLETTDLVHHYSTKEKVLDHINLRVTEGGIYGFLGPNGAGKTTTLRLVLGLLKKQQGTISIFGKPLESNRVSILRKTGSLIETPSMYSQLTAYENLSVLQKIYRCPKENISKALELVELSRTAEKKAGQFSLGMKQRLGIAMAILNNPSLLILDEPTNGLDPNGMIEIRELLRKLNKTTGATIVISSHLLSEIEKLATHVGIIHKGKMMFQGTLDELKIRQQPLQRVVVETSNDARAAGIIRNHNIDPRLENGKIILPAISRQQIASLNRELIGAGIDIRDPSRNQRPRIHFYGSDKPLKPHDLIICT